MSCRTSDSGPRRVPPPLPLSAPVLQNGYDCVEGRSADGILPAPRSGTPRTPFRKPTLVWWISLVGACIASSAAIHEAWGPVPWQVPRADARRLDTVINKLESGLITPGMCLFDANLPKPLAWEVCYTDAASAEGVVAYGAQMFYSGQEWVTVYYGGRKMQIFAVVQAGNGKVDGERWYFCDFEMLRTYIEANMRQWHDDMQAGLYPPPVGFFLYAEWVITFFLFALTIAIPIMRRLFHRRRHRCV